MDPLLIEAIELRLSIKLPSPYPAPTAARLALIQATIDRLVTIDKGIDDATKNSIATSLGGMAISPARAISLHKSEGTRQVTILANLLGITDFTNPYSSDIKYSIEL
jgi:hypothetical protein